MDDIRPPSRSEPENSQNPERRPPLPPNNASSSEDQRIDRLRRAMYSRSLSRNIKERDRREMDPSPQIVGEDFKEKDAGVPEKMVAPRGILYMRNFLWLLLGGSIVFFIATVAFFGYYFFFGAGSIAALPGNIDIAIAGPPQIAGGQASALQIVVTNRNNVALQSADLVVHFPKGTR